MTALDSGRALRLHSLSEMSDEERVRSLLDEPEGQWFARKSSRIEGRALADALAGFANAEGGLIAIGLRSGHVEGVRANAHRENDWRQAARTYLQPPVAHRFQTFACTNEAGEPDDIAVIEVDASVEVHRNVRDETYLRVGDENRRLSLAETQELEYDKGQSIYDGRPVRQATLADLDDRLLAAYIRALRTTTPAEAVLSARGLAVADGGITRPTVAGYLLFGREPQREFPEAFIRVLRHQGTVRGSGARSGVLDDRRIEGALTLQIEGAKSWLKKNVPAPLRLGRSGRFRTSSLIPEDAWLEGVVNAVVHRSYSMAGDHTRIEAFDNRIEFESPGRLPGLVRLENIRSTRFARNPRIARGLTDLGYGRELGEGVDRMFEEMDSAGLPEPSFRHLPASLHLTLVAEPELAQILADLPADVTPLVHLLLREARITTSDAMESTGLSRPTAIRYLRLLEDRGFIRHVATSPTDPRATWQLHRGRGLSV